jgi:1-acyl-sn-glycerol-3-phosphate acyltransferase
MKNAPSALIVPISINNSWKMLKYGKFPVGLLSHITFDVQPAIAIEGDLDEIIAKAEASVVSGVTSFNDR